MDMDIVNLISTCGFPIAACCALFWLYNKTVTGMTETNAKMSATLEKVNTTLDNLDKTIDRIFARLEAIEARLNQNERD